MAKKGDKPAKAKKAKAKAKAKPAKAKPAKAKKAKAKPAKAKPAKGKPAKAKPAKPKKGDLATQGGTGGGVRDARNPELEKAIVADPDDDAAYSVLGDWLEAQGDPRGELIALQLAGKDEEAKALIEKHADYFLGPLAEHQLTHDGTNRPAFEWKNGYIHGLRLSHDENADPELKGSMVEVLDEVLRHPSGRFLSEITFGFNGNPSEDDLQDLIDLLANRAPPTLRKLHFGEFSFAGDRGVGEGPDTEISWYGIGDLSKLWKAVPGLRMLITQGGSTSALAGGSTFGKIELPNLRRAELRSGGLDAANARSVATAEIPKIEHLDIWYGDDAYGGDATIEDVEPLLARTDLPKLRHLGLMNSEFADQLPEALAKSKLLPQLRELDLSMGTMTDEGARELVRRRDSFKHLDKLDVSRNYLSPAGVAMLKGVAKRVEAGDQRPDEDPEYRHPAVAE